MNKNKLNVIHLYNTNYKEILELQRELRQRRIVNEISDCLLLVTHNHVLTLGKRGKHENILASKETLTEKGVSIYEIERGGDITYHGPGQLVIYPIIDLKNYKRDVRGFVDKLQNAVVNLLKDEYDIDAHKEDGTHTGIWVKKNKIAAIGLSLSKWVTIHGMAFNINTNLDYFDLIVPCGLIDRGVTSIKKIVGREIDFSKATNLFVKYFSEQLNCDINITDLENI